MRISTDAAFPSGLFTSGRFIPTDFAEDPVRVLKEFDKIWPMHLFFSPNGRYLAYDFTVAEDDGKRDIALLLIDGTGTIPVVRHPADEKLLGWIPGTESILFSSDRSGTEDAWSVQIQDGRPKDVPELIKRGLGNIDPRGFSRDGSFFYSVDSRYYALQVAPFDPSTGTLQPESSTTISGSNVIGDWSHDGELLTYISFEGPGPAGTPNSRRRVHVRNWKSGEEKKFDFEDLIISRPLWAPDGQRILAAGWKAPNSQGDGKQGLFQIDASNGRLSPLAIFAVRPQAPYLWSQDGQAIIYADRGCLWMRETASNLERELYCQPNLAPFAALSPDGRNLAFGTVDRQKGTTSVLLMPSNGGPVREFFAIPGSSPPAGLTWTPDGNQLLYVNRENGTSAFYRISLNGGNPEKLWQSRDNVLAISMHPEGRLIAFSTFVGQSEIWIMENIAGRK